MAHTPINILLAFLIAFLAHSQPPSRHCQHVRFWPIGVIRVCTAHVCFWPKAASKQGAFRTLLQVGRMPGANPWGRPMRRREFVTLLGSAAVIWPLSARAQKPTRIPRIGVLWHAGSAEEEGRYFTGFIEGLRDLGYADGSNIILEHRFPNETPDRFRKMAAELVSMNVDVLVSVGSQTAFYAKDATTTIPI